MTYYSVVQTDLALLQRMFSRYRLLLILRGCISLCQVSQVSQKPYQTPGRDVWSIKWLKHHYFWEIRVSPTMWVFSPLWETCEQLRRNSFASHRMNLSGHSSKIMRDIFFFRNWNVTFFWPVRERQTSSLRAKQEEFVDSWPELT